MDEIDRNLDRLRRALRLRGDAGAPAIEPEAKEPAKEPLQSKYSPAMAPPPRAAPSAADSETSARVEAPAAANAAAPVVKKQQPDLGAAADVAVARPEASVDAPRKVGDAQAAGLPRPVRSASLWRRLKSIFGLR